MCSPSVYVLYLSLWHVNFFTLNQDKLKAGSKINGTIMYNKLYHSNLLFSWEYVPHLILKLACEFDEPKEVQLYFE